MPSIEDRGQADRVTILANCNPNTSLNPSSSSSFYLPNNTTVYTFAWIRFRRAGQQGPIRTLTAALKRSIKNTTMTYDLDFRSSTSCGHVPYTCKKIQVKGHLAQKTQSGNRRTVEQTRPIAVPCPLP